MYSIKVPAAEGRQPGATQDREGRGACTRRGEGTARMVGRVWPGRESYVPSLALPLNVPTLRKYLWLGPLQRSWGPHTQLVEDKS